MLPAACIRLCCRDLAWVGVFARRTMSSASQNSSNNVEEDCIIIWRVNFDFRISIGPHYGCNNFFG